jgi:hypothetical protein
LPTNLTLWSACKPIQEIGYGCNDFSKMPIKKSKVEDFLIEVEVFEDHTSQ